MYSIRKILGIWRQQTRYTLNSCSKCTQVDHRPPSACAYVRVGGCWSFCAWPQDSLESKLFRLRTRTMMPASTAIVARLPCGPHSRSASGCRCSNPTAARRRLASPQRAVSNRSLPSPHFPILPSPARLVFSFDFFVFCPFSRPHALWLSAEQGGLLFTTVS